MNNVGYSETTKVQMSFPCSGLYSNATAVYNALGCQNLMLSEHTQYSDYSNLWILKNTLDHINDDLVT